MFGRKRQSAEPPEPAAEQQQQPTRLREAIRTARIESAERTGVVVDLRDAEAARLELLNEALAPVFAEIPDDIDMFDNGISRGDTPRLWIDSVAHVAMGHDKRLYRFVQDTRHGRKLIVETPQVNEAAAAVTRYVAGRLIERERALTEDSPSVLQNLRREAVLARRARRGRAIRAFAFGLLVGFAALFLILWALASRQL